MVNALYRRDRHSIRRTQRALTQLADREFDAILPGYTHLQRAQPILLAPPSGVRRDV